MSEYHVSSLVVHAMANRVNEVKAKIEQLNGTEVPATSDAGKLVVLVEGDSRHILMETFERIKALPSVMAATLIFHQVENEEDNSMVDGVQL